MLNEKHGKNFIPIAEEYIRKGLLDEAIDLLKAGIEIYPGYLSARVSLGKAYIEKGMMDEAAQEFEHVVGVSPDNLLAHKKLAFLYRESGRIDSAINSCEAVLFFSPRDVEISELLRSLKSEQNEDSRGYTVSDDHKSSPVIEGVSPEIDFTSGWEVAPVPVEAGHDNLHDEFLTESMGDICIAQGEKAKGIEIFRKILKKDPDNESVKDKLTELGGMTAAQGGNASVRRNEQQVERLTELLRKVQTHRDKMS